MKKKNPEATRGKYDGFKKLEFDISEFDIEDTVPKSAHKKKDE